MTDVATEKERLAQWLLLGGLARIAPSLAKVMVDLRRLDERHEADQAAAAPAGGEECFYLNPATGKPCCEPEAPRRAESTSRSKCANIADMLRPYDEPLETIHAAAKKLYHAENGPAVRDAANLVHGGLLQLLAEKIEQTTRIELLSSALSEWTGEVEALRTERDSLKAAVERLAAARAEWEGTARAQGDTVEALGNEVVAFQKDAREWTADRDRLQGELARREAVVEAAKAHAMQLERSTIFGLDSTGPDSTIWVLREALSALQPPAVEPAPQVEATELREP